MSQGPAISGEVVFLAIDSVSPCVSERLLAMRIVVGEFFGWSVRN